MLYSGTLDLKRDGTALVLHSSNTARWFGILIGGFALAWTIGWARMSDGDIPMVLGFALGLGFIVAGVVLALSHEIITTFDPRSRRVLIDRKLCSGWYRQSYSYAFGEVAGVGVKEYSSEGYSYMPVLVLRSGEVRWLAVMNGSYLDYRETLDGVAAATGLDRVDVPSRSSGIQQKS